MKLPWKQFSLRTLLVAMSVVCVALGTWSVYVNPYRLQANSLAAVKRLNGTYELRPAEGPAWQWWLVTTMVGEEAFSKVISVQIPPGQLELASLRPLVGLTHLEHLTLPPRSLNDETVSILKPMKKLRSLTAPYAQVSDRAASTFGSLSQLETLQLIGAPLSDSSIDELAKLTQLRSLFIRWTEITDDGRERLAEALPNCEIYHHALAGE
jgi:hypothetical protein